MNHSKTNPNKAETEKSQNCTLSNFWLIVTGWVIKKHLLQVGNKNLVSGVGWSKKRAKGA